MTGWFTAQLACATCFGDPGSAMTQGMNLAIITMLGVTALVLGGCAAGIWMLAKRARENAQLNTELDPILKETQV